MNTRQYFEIEGLEGQKTLEGVVSIGGAKNAALKAMAAAVLFDGPVILQNVPDIEDIETLANILRKMGATVVRSADHEYVVDAVHISKTDVDRELAGSMRASVVLTGPLLARFGKLTLPAPGGCVLGSRPIDLFLSGYEKMGARTVEEDELYKISGKLTGTEIFFSKISVGATETIMMAASIAGGTTVLKNCAQEPEIVNVAQWLNDSGARIKGAGTSTIEIDGTGGKLLRAKSPYVAISDRIETASFLFLGALLARNLEIKNCQAEHVESVTSLLEKSGVPLRVEKDSIVIHDNVAANSDFKSFDIRTQEYPGFPTDAQPPAVTFLTQTKGESMVVETIYDGRFKYTEDLQKMGAHIAAMNPREILVKGPSHLRQLPGGEELNARDIRAGFAIVMAALVAKGKFKVNNIHLIDRGYERLEEKLMALGARVRRIIP